MLARDINPVEGLVARQDIDDAHQAAVLCSAFNASLMALAHTYGQVVGMLTEATLADWRDEDRDIEVFPFSENDLRVLDAMTAAIEASAAASIIASKSLVNPLLGTKGNA